MYAVRIHAGSIWESSEFPDRIANHPTYKDAWNAFLTTAARWAQPDSGLTVELIWINPDNPYDIRIFDRLGGETPRGF